MAKFTSRVFATAVALTLGLAGSLHADDHWPAQPPAEAPADWGPVSANFEEIPYPYPVHFLELTRFDQQMRMAYMDIPSGAPIDRILATRHELLTPYDTD
ncbi:MAG: hypothetical protein ACE37N_17575 [Pseudohongiellaceae bacterium]